MKLTAQQIINYVSDYIGDENHTDYPIANIIQDLNIINQKWITKANLNKGGEDANASLSETLNKVVGGSATLTLEDEAPINFIEYQKNGDNNWHRIEEQEIADLENPIEYYRDLEDLPYFYIRKNNTIELIPTPNEELSVKVFHSDNTNTFTTGDLTITSILNSATHDVLVWDTLRYYYSKMDMAEPKYVKENFLEAYNTFQKIYAPIRTFKMSLKKTKIT